MKIRFIPETAEEKSKSKPKDIEGVKEYLLFGNRKDEDGDLIDFHEWKGAYRYLLSGLDYFHTIINDERRNADPVLARHDNKMMKRGTIPSSNIETLDAQEIEPEQQDQIIDVQVEDLNRKSNLTLLNPKDQND